MSGPSLGARIRAARMLAGIESAKELAERLELRGSGATHLYKAERDERGLPYPVYAEIAHVCRLPVEFFSADFTRVAEISDDPRRVIAEETAAALERAHKRRAERGEGNPSRRRADR